MNLNIFLNNGIKNIADTAARFYLKNSKGRTFMLHTFAAFQKGAKIRQQYEDSGTHVPPFLIASIATACNLRCSGCYARANGGCGSGLEDQQLSAADWKRIFTEADQIGISFILLAGGEPLMRRDVIEIAAGFPNIIFPVFTNGTMIDQSCLELFDQHRNLIPVLSVEGDDQVTDARRGKGVAKKVWEAAAKLQEKGILFGTSVTVTRENQELVTEPSFAGFLRERGCGLIFFIEYVPAEENTEHLMLTDQDLAKLQQRVDRLRRDKANKGTIILSFPGDEEAMGGCLAAGRGFFHISPGGGAEPCPFSPFSELNLRNQSLLAVLQSPFFAEVQKISAAEALEHKGGCTLFQHKDKVLEAVSVK